MAMSEREAHALFDLLHRAYPTYPMDDGTSMLYTAALMRDPYPSATAAEAVRKWITNESQFPKVNELLDAIKAEAAHRHDSRDMGALPPGHVAAVSDGVAMQYIALMRQVREEMPPPVHRHHFGSATCSGCSARVEYEARFAERMEQLVVERGLKRDTPSETFTCGQCLDVGFVEEFDGSVWVNVPCPCNPSLYDRWREGHMEPNHSCAECDALRRGKRIA